MTDNDPDWTQDDLKSHPKMTQVDLNLT